MYTKGIVELQRRIYEQTGRRTDAHYKDGYGALFVFEGETLTLNNVIYAANEMELAFLSF